MAQKKLIRKNNILKNWEHQVDPISGNQEYWSPGIVGNDQLNTDDVLPQIPLRNNLGNINSYEDYRFHKDYISSVFKEVVNDDEFHKLVDSVIYELLPTQEEVEEIQNTQTIPPKLLEKLIVTLSNKLNKTFYETAKIIATKYIPFSALVENADNATFTWKFKNRVVSNLLEFYKNVTEFDKGSWEFTVENSNGSDSDSLNLEIFNPLNSKYFDTNIVKNWDGSENLSNWEVITGNPAVDRDWRAPDFSGQLAVFWDIQGNPIMPNEFSPDINNGFKGFWGGTGDVNDAVSEMVQEIDLSEIKDVVNGDYYGANNITGLLTAYLGGDGVLDFNLVDDNNNVIDNCKALNLDKVYVKAELYDDADRLLDNKWIDNAILINSNLNFNINDFSPRPTALATKGQQNNAYGVKIVNTQDEVNNLYYALDNLIRIASVTDYTTNSDFVKDQLIRWLLIANDKQIIHDWMGAQLSNLPWPNQANKNSLTNFYNLSIRNYVNIMYSIFRQIEYDNINTQLTTFSNAQYIQALLLYITNNNPLGNRIRANYNAATNSSYGIPEFQELLAGQGFIPSLDPSGQVVNPLLMGYPGTQSYVWNSWVNGDNGVYGGIDGRPIRKIIIDTLIDEGQDGSGLTYIQSSQWQFYYINQYTIYSKIAENLFSTCVWPVCQSSLWTPMVITSAHLNDPTFSRLASYLIANSSNSQTSNVRLRAEKFYVPKDTRKIKIRVVFYRNQNYDIHKLTDLQNQYWYNAYSSNYIPPQWSTIPATISSQYAYHPIYNFQEQMLGRWKQNYKGVYDYRNNNVATFINLNLFVEGVNSTSKKDVVDYNADSIQIQNADNIYWQGILRNNFWRNLMFWNKDNIESTFSSLFNRISDLRLILNPTEILTDLLGDIWFRNNFTFTEMQAAMSYTANPQDVYSMTILMNGHTYRKQNYGKKPPEQNSAVSGGYLTTTNTTSMV